MKDSFILTNCYLLWRQCKYIFLHSIIYHLYRRIKKGLNGAFCRSSIIAFLRCDWEKPFRPQKSKIFHFVASIGNGIGYVIKKSEGGLAKEVRNSAIIRILNPNFIIFLLCLLLFALPFLPTMLLAFLSLATIGVYILNILVGKIRLRAPDFVSILVVLFGFTFFASAVTSYNFPKSMQVFAIFMSFLLLFFVIKDCVNTEAKFNIVMNIFILSGVLVALYGIYQYIIGVEMDAAWVDANSFEEITTRAYATFSNPNVLGEYLILLTSITVGMLWKTKAVFMKGIYLAACGILALGLLATNSRGSMLGLLLAAGIFVLFAEKRLIPLGILGIAALPFIMPATLWERLASVITLQDSSSLYRMSIYAASILILKNYWISGIGVDAFNNIYPLFSFEAAYAYHSHNLFLQEFIELGILGFTFLILAILFYFQRLYYGINRSKKRFKYMIAAIFGGFAGVLLQGLVDYLWFDYSIVLLFWCVFGLGIAAVKIGVKHENERRNEKKPVFVQI